MSPGRKKIFGRKDSFDVFIFSILGAEDRKISPPPRLERPANCCVKICDCRYRQPAVMKSSGRCSLACACLLLVIGCCRYMRCFEYDRSNSTTTAIPLSFRLLDFDRSTSTCVILLFYLLHLKFLLFSLV